MTTYTVHTSSWYSISHIAQIADLVMGLPVGQTATIVQSGMSNTDPHGTCTVARYLDGFTITTAADPVPLWVQSLRELITQNREQSEVPPPDITYPEGTP